MSCLIPRKLWNKFCSAKLTCAFAVFKTQALVPRVLPGKVFIPNPFTYVLPILGFHLPSTKTGPLHAKPRRC